MNKLFRLLIFSTGLTLLSCRHEYSLKNIKWRLTKFIVDSSNYLSQFEKNVYTSFDTSTNLVSEFGDSIVLTYVIGRVPDTSNYYLHGDSLFYVQGQRRDTTIIVKLSRDSLVDRRLAGVTAYRRRLEE